MDLKTLLYRVGEITFQLIPLGNVYNFNTYGDQAVDLLHYLRNVQDHCKDYMA